MPQDQQYWFPAKRYGWGWGIPATWQGWAVMAAFLVLIVIGAVAFPPHRAPAIFVSYVVMLSIVLTGVCWWKGEPPRWRWGGE
jgi:hypothetical protein